jgi:probable phosphoglycerate mutase
MQRASLTCQKAGFWEKAKTEKDLTEWNYGDYEGLTSSQIWKESPGWNIFSHGAPGGESPADIGARADRILSKIQPINGNVLLFSHGHFLRVLAARWLQLGAIEGRLFALFPASLSILGYEKAAPVLTLWNEV